MPAPIANIPLPVIIAKPPIENGTASIPRAIILPPRMTIAAANKTTHSKTASAHTTKASTTAASATRSGKVKEDEDDCDLSYTQKGKGGKLVIQTDSGDVSLDCR